MKQRLETAAFVAVMSLGIAGFCWNLWDFAATTSQADLHALALFYFKAAGVMALVVVPGVTYLFWDHRRAKK